jgi:hypothetical protein
MPPPREPWPITRPVLGHETTRNGLTLAYKIDIEKKMPVVFDAPQYWTVTVFRGTTLDPVSFVAEESWFGTWQEIEDRLTAYTIN